MQLQKLHENTFKNILLENCLSHKIQASKNPQLIDVRTPEEYAVEHLTKRYKYRTGMELIL